MDIEEGTSCSVCMEEVAQYRVHTCKTCHQPFCHECITSWILKSTGFPKCPVCRESYPLDCVESLTFCSNAYYVEFIRGFICKLNNMYCSENESGEREHLIKTFLTLVSHPAGLSLRRDPEFHSILKERLIIMYQEKCSRSMQLFLEDFFDRITVDYTASPSNFPASGISS